MKCVELNAEADFAGWEDSKILELKQGRIVENLGQKQLFENDNIKVWEVILFPGERLPFRRITHNYTFSSSTEGMAISRSASGKIVLIRINKGDSLFMKHEGDEAIYDFENIGDNLLFLHAMEFKPLIKHVDDGTLRSMI